MKKFLYFCTKKKSLIYYKETLERMNTKEEKKEIKRRRNAIRLIRILKKFRFVKFAWEVR